MPRTSRSTLTSSQLEMISGHFTQLIHILSDSKKIDTFFSEFYTPEEKIMLSKRLVLFMLLRKGYKPSEIRDLLHISYETIRSYQYHLTQKDKVFLDSIDKLLKQKKTSEFLRSLHTILRPLEIALDAKSNMRARAKLLSGDYS